MTHTHDVLRVSIPFIAGQWSLHVDWKHRRCGKPRVSIPFIAGQWSLPRRGVVLAVAATKFQSPSLRGSGRFTATSAT